MPNTPPKYDPPRKCPLCWREPFYAKDAREWAQHNREVHPVPKGKQSGKATRHGKRTVAGHKPF